MVGSSYLIGCEHLNFIALDLNNKICGPMVSTHSPHSRYDNCESNECDTASIIATVSTASKASFASFVLSKSWWWSHIKWRYLQRQLV